MKRAVKHSALQQTNGMTQKQAAVMENKRMSKMKWTILSALVWLNFANITFEAFRAMLRRPDYADLLCNGDYPALFKKREILAMTDDLHWYFVWVAPMAGLFILVSLILSIVSLLGLWN